jgi:hypothetical protein
VVYFSDSYIDKQVKFSADLLQWSVSVLSTSDFIVPSASLIIAYTLIFLLSMVSLAVESMTKELREWEVESESRTVNV